MAIRALNTNRLIESVVRRAMLPDNQSTFKEEDFLAFANEEMDMGIVPHVLSFHEDYFLHPQATKLDSNESRYEIPHRSIGNKIRDVFYQDDSKTVYELTRIMVEDIPFFQYGSLGAITNPLRAFYVEGTEIVLLPNNDYVGPSGTLNFHYYLRPNTLVSEDRITYITEVDYNKGIFKVSNIPENFEADSIFDITSNKSSYKLVAIDLVPSNYASTTNLTYTFGTQRIFDVTCLPKSQINTGDYLLIGDNTGPKTVLRSLWFDLTGTDAPPVVTDAIMYRIDLSGATTANDVANAISTSINTFLSPILISSVNGAVLNIRNGGNAICVGPNFDVVNFGTIVMVQQGTNFIPKKVKKGDIMALSEETIIPQVPVELHSMLAQRIACRCLEALGDQQGLQAALVKLQEMEQKTGSLIDNRVEGSPMKVANRHSFLNTTKRYIRR